MSWFRILLHALTCRLQVARALSHIEVCSSCGVSCEGGGAIMRVRSCNHICTGMHGRGLCWLIVVVSGSRAHLHLLCQLQPTPSLPH